MATTSTEIAAAVRAERHWLEPLIRIGISTALLYGSYLVAAQAMAEWHFRRHTAAEIQNAIRWNPHNPEYYVARARVLQVSLEGSDINEVIRLYETATRLRPSRAEYWADLAGGYEWAGREQDARRAYERARELFPNSPAINWKLGNFYIRVEKVPEALQALRKTLAGDPEMGRPVFDVVWRAGVNDRRILREMIPPDAKVLLAYLDYLVETQRLDEASAVWKQLLGQATPFEPQEAFPYLDALIQRQRAEELRAAWGTLMERSRSGMQHRSLDGNLITNGSFEAEILNGGLDWRILHVEGAAVGLDSLNPFDGTHALCIQFDGQHNLDYSHVLEYVPVEPNFLYRFSGYIRAERITSDSGPRFQILDAHDASKLSVSTEGVLGTLAWSPQQLQFRTGPDTRLLIVRLVRPPSRLFDGRISGIVWIDRLSLTRVE